MWNKIDQVTFPIECSAIEGRKEMIRKIVKSHKAKLTLRQTTCSNGYLMLKGMITVEEGSYIKSRAKMWEIIDAIGISPAILSNKY